MKDIQRPSPPPFRRRRKAALQVLALVLILLASLALYMAATGPAWERLGLLALVLAGMLLGLSAG